MNEDFPNYLSGDATEVARQLLGAIIIREVGDQQIRLRIVETESYDQYDSASHSYNGRTPRTDVMFGPCGHAYVYFTYGMHYCFNIVTGEDGIGSGVLIRGLEPLDHQEFLEKRRGRGGVEVTNGPAKLCQALGIDRRLAGHDLRQSPLRLSLGEPIPDDQIVATKRIGISRNTDALRRFYIRGNRYVSKK